MAKKVKCGDGDRSLPKDEDGIVGVGEEAFFLIVIKVHHPTAISAEMAACDTQRTLPI